MNNKTGNATREDSSASANTAVQERKTNERIEEIGNGRNGLREEVEGKDTVDCTVRAGSAEGPREDVFRETSHEKNAGMNCRMKKIRFCGGKKERVV